MMAAFIFVVSVVIFLESFVFHCPAPLRTLGVSVRSAETSSLISLLCHSSGCQSCDGLCLNASHQLTLGLSGA